MIKLKNILLESIKKIPGNKLICVDIQPAYLYHISFNLQNWISSLAEFKGKILYLYNGPDLGYESENQIKNWLFELLDYDEESFKLLIKKIIFVDKGYGFFRDAIDDTRIYTKEIVTLIAYMIKNKYWDTRDLKKNEIPSLKISRYFKEQLISENISLFIPDFISILKSFSGATIVGGSKNECLLEIKILLDALNKNYKLFNSFIY